MYTDVFRCICLGAAILASSSASASSAVADPEPLRTVPVSSSGELTSALAAAQPGDHLLLADGTYEGFLVSRSGREADPIVIRAGNILEAKVRGSITVTGDYVWIVGMDMQANQIAVHGQRDRVSRNRLGKVDFPIVMSSIAHNATVDHNEIDHGGTGGDPADRRGIRMNYSATGSDYNHHIHHNYLHNTGGKNNNAIVSSENGATRDLNTGTIIEYNLVENWSGGRCVGLKSGWNIIRFNTCLNCVREEMVNRAGQHNQWIANWIENCGALRIMDIHNTAIGNYSPKTGVWLHIGNTYRDGPPATAGANYYRVEDALVVANTGPLSIGEHYTSVAPQLPVINSTIEAHKGSISYGLHSGIEVLDKTAREVPAAFKLSPSDVGPFAPTAPFNGATAARPGTRGRETAAAAEERRLRITGTTQSALTMWLPSDGRFEVCVCNIAGRRLWSVARTVRPGRCSTPLPAFPPGVYTVTLSQGNRIAFGKAVIAK
jgi:hypothetical protein